MNALKYLGVLILIAGVLVLAVPYMTSGGTTNTFLTTGMVLIVVGYFSHIILNKKIQ